MSHTYTRRCVSCGGKFSASQKMVALYDISVGCKHCGLQMELSLVVLIVNMSFAHIFAAIVMHFTGMEKSFFYFFIAELWALFIFLPLITLICFGVKRH